MFRRTDLDIPLEIHMCYEDLRPHYSSQLQVLIKCARHSHQIYATDGV